MKTNDFHDNAVSLGKTLFEAIYALNTGSIAPPYLTLSKEERDGWTSLGEETLKNSVTEHLPPPGSIPIYMRKPILGSQY